MKTNGQNTQKHTPGPWRENGSVVTAQGSMALIVANVRCQLDPIVRPDAAAKTFAERDANARLIAAAPTMHNYLTLLAMNGDDKAHEIIQEITRI